jgi:hypothetical protein
MAQAPRPEPDKPPITALSPLREPAGCSGYRRATRRRARWGSRVHGNGYSEALTAGNPFPATSSPGTNIMNVATIGAQYTRLVTDKIEASINLDVERSFGSKDGITTTIAGVAAAQPGPHEYTWYDYGVRFGYRATTSLTVDLFVDGSVAPHAIGNQVHGGIGLRFFY